MAAVPGALYGLSEMTRGLADRFEEGSDTREAVNLAANAERSLAAGWGGMQIKNMFGADPANQVDIARIQSGSPDTGRNQLPPNAIDDIEKDTAALKGKNTKAQLFTEAKRLGLNPKNAMNKTQLSELLLNSGKKISSKVLSALPIAAGGFAAGLTAYDQADAAGFGDVEKAATGLGTGAAVGGGVYGLMEGGKRLANKLGQYGAGRAAMQAVPLGMAALAAKDGYDFMMQPKLGGFLEPQSQSSEITDPAQLEAINKIMQQANELQQRRSMTHGPNQLGQY